MLALCGWERDTPETEAISCSICRRTVGLWNFTSNDTPPLSSEVQHELSSTSAATASADSDSHDHGDDEQSANNGNHDSHNNNTVDNNSQVRKRKRTTQVAAPDTDNSTVLSVEEQRWQRCQTTPTTTKRARTDSSTSADCKVSEADDLTRLQTRSGVPYLHPIMQHRSFCPWVCALRQSDIVKSPSKKLRGDALYMLTAAGSDTQPGWIACLSALVKEYSSRLTTADDASQTGQSTLSSISRFALLAEPDFV
jgi:Rsm1-like